MAADKPLPEHVEIIQKLMLRAPQHRAILIPTMLLIGLVSLALGISLTLKTGIETPLYSYPISTGFWVFSWLTAALAPALLSIFLASKEAKKAEHEIDSPQLRHIFRSLAPALISGFIIGTLVSFHDVRSLPLTAAIWIASYGVALLAIRIYCTRSAGFLGILMLALGLTYTWVALRVEGVVHPIHLANFFMCVAFGMFHLIVASGSILFAKANA
jgi:ABC-type transporter Mla maintaining outer membrane lipid asymmetry permease subunit MlaE